MHRRAPHLPRLMEQANDVERNPGPPKMSKNALIAVKKGEKLPHCGNGSARHNGSAAIKQEEEREEAHVATIASEEGVNEEDEGGGGGAGEMPLKNVVERQSELLRQQREDLDELRRKLEENTRLTVDFKSELSEIRKNWQNINGEYSVAAAANSTSSGKKSSSEETSALGVKVDSLVSAYNDIQDRLYEIDKSWKNNLVVYGIPCSESADEDPLVTEEKVRDVLHKKLHISREIAMSRIGRIWHGPDFRGHKPIQLCIVNYRDKEEILRKARLLKGSNIYISEDFSRKVREHRHELIKFMKEVRSRDPARRMTLRYDKLYMDKDIYLFNDRSGRVERLHQHLDLGTSTNALIGNLIINDSQVSSFSHDPSWLRRPRSRMGHASFLSRQNSMSMEDVNQQSPSKSVNGRNGIRRTPRSAASSASRTRKPLFHAPAVTKSVSVDSLDYDSDGGGGAIVYPVARYHHHPRDFYCDDDRGNGGGGAETPSPTKQRGKMVVFTGVPETDCREIVRVPNGAQQHYGYHYRRNGGGDESSDEEGGVMTVDTVSRTYEQTFLDRENGVSRRALMHVPSSEYAPTPLPLPPIGSGPFIVEQHHHFPPIATSATTTNNNNNNLPALMHSSVANHLPMNFAHNGGYLAEPDRLRMLKYEEQEEDRRRKERSAIDVKTQSDLMMVQSAGQNGQLYNQMNGQTNGVLKVAMYGEFPISSTNMTIAAKPESN